MYDFYMDMEHWKIWLAIGTEIQIWRPLDSDVGMWFFIHEDEIFAQTRLF